MSWAFDKTGKVYFIFNICCVHITSIALMLDLFPSSLHLLLFAIFRYYHYSNSHHSNRVNENKFRTIGASSTGLRYSFAVRTVSDWNQLPAVVVEQENPAAFKAQLARCATVRMPWTTTTISVILHDHCARQDKTKQSSVTTKHNEEQWNSDEPCRSCEHMA